MYKKLTAIALSTSLLLGTLPAVPAAAEKSAALPEWVPQDFCGALDFEETYGITHTENGLICVLVMNELQEENAQTHQLTASEGLEVVYEQTLTFDLTDEDLQEPDPNDPDYKQKLREYEERMGKYGIRSSEPFMVDYYKSINYVATVYKPTQNGTSSVKNTLGDNSVTYTFDTSDDGITETDFHGWVPDCMTEYRAFIQDNGNLSCRDQYIIYCGDVNHSTGAELNIETNGVEVERVYYSGVSRKSDMFMAGNAAHLVMVYEAKEPGKVKMTFTTAIPWAPEGSGEVVESRFRVNDDLTVEEIPIVLHEPIMGDVNDDEDITVLDVIALQKYLLGIGKLGNDYNADLNQDGCVDVFDLALLKRLILKYYTERPLDPTEPPTEAPTVEPSEEPTEVPTMPPTQPVQDPTEAPTEEPQEVSVKSQSLDKSTYGAFDRSDTERKENAMYILNTYDEYKAQVGDAETITEVNEALFENKAVVAAYTFSMASTHAFGNRSLTRKGNTLILNMTRLVDPAASPDLGVHLFLFVVDKSALEGVTETSFIFHDMYPMPEVDY